MKKRIIILLLTLLSIAAVKTYSPGTSPGEKYPLSRDFYREPRKEER